MFSRILIVCLSVGLGFAQTGTLRSRLGLPPRGGVNANANAALAGIQAQIGTKVPPGASCTVQYDNVKKCWEDKQRAGEDPDDEVAGDSLPARGRACFQRNCPDGYKKVQSLRQCVKQQLPRLVLEPMRTCLQAKNVTDLHPVMFPLAGGAKFARANNQGGSGGRFGGQLSPEMRQNFEELKKEFCPNLNNLQMITCVGSNQRSSGSGKTSCLAQVSQTCITNAEKTLEANKAKLCECGKQIFTEDKKKEVSAAMLTCADGAGIKVTEERKTKIKTKLEKKTKEICDSDIAAWTGTGEPDV